MTRNLLVAMALAASFNANAQSEPKPVEKSSKREIVVEERSSGTNQKMVIVIDGNNVTINGKPAEDYKGKKRIVMGKTITIDGDVIELPRDGRLTLRDLNGEKRAFLGVTTEKADNGAEIKLVSEGSAAEKAGLKVGDIIVKLETSTIANPADLQGAVAKAKPDQTVTLSYLRGGKAATTTAKLGQANQDMAFNWNFGEGDFETAMTRLPRPPAPPRMGGRALEYPNPMALPRINPLRPKYGFSLEDNPDADGVIVTDVETGSYAEKAGLKKDDQITAINNEPVKNIDGLREQMAAKKDAANHTLTVLRSGTTQKLTIRVPKVIKKADF